MSSPYTNRKENKRLYAMCGDRPMGAVNHTHIRAYVFPFFTPAGVTVLQECPPDHQHHQGIGVGQDLVNGHNFWAQMHKGYPLNRQVGSPAVIDEDAAGIGYTHDLHWVAVDDQHIVDERRALRFEAWEGGNFLEIHATFTAAYGDVFFGQTKEGGLGMRVAQQLETSWGGLIRSADGETGGDRVWDTTADWIEVSGSVGPNEVGIVFMPHPSMEKIPWFTRDYGLHNYGPFRHRAFRLPFGESFSWRAAFFAYDGISDGSQAADAWNCYGG